MAPDKQSLTELHRSTDDTTGTAIAAGKVVQADGIGGVVWGDASAAAAGYYYRAVDYGAVGDGVTDDTVTLQAAIDDIPDYATLWLQGHYIITDTLVIGHPIRLLGDSASPNWFAQSTIIEMTTANTTAISCTDFEGLVSVDSLEILGPGSAASGRGIYSAANVNLWHVKVKGFYDGVYIDDSLGDLASSAYYNHIAQCWIDTNAHAGLLLHDRVNNTTVSETYFAFQPYGLYADGGGWGLQIVNSSFEAHSINGICIDGVGDTQSSEAALISGCYFENRSVGGTPDADISLGPATTVTGVTIIGGVHVESDVATLDHIQINFADRVTIIGTVIQSDTENSSIATTANTTNVTLINVEAAGTVTTPATTRILDQTDVTPASVAGANAVGTSKYLARADHVHQGTSGTAATTVESETTFGITPAVGTDTEYARQDHTHGSPPEPATGAVGPILITDTPAGSPLVFSDLLQDEAGTDLLYADA